jgi:hypothetical protein
MEAASPRTLSPDTLGPSGVLPEGDWPAQFHLLQKEPMTLLEKELVVNPSITFEHLE